MIKTETILFGKEARKAIELGVDKVCNAVKVTLGAAGRNAVVSYHWGQLSSRDGVTVARSIQLPDPIQRAGAEVIKEVATKMLSEVGDATTTACVLAQAIVKRGMELIEGGANPVELKKGIDYAVKNVVEELKRISIPCDNYDRMLQVATVSSNNDKELGELIAGAFNKVGGDGVVLIEDAVNRNTSIKLVDGLQFDKGYGMAEFFITNPAKMNCEMTDVHILIWDGAITTMREIAPILEQVLRIHGAKLLIIAGGIENEAYAFLGANRSQNPQTFQVCMVEAPLFGNDRTEALEDIAILTNGQMCSEAKGFKLETLKLENLGKASRVTVSKNSTTIVDGGGAKEDVQMRVDQLKMQLEETTEEGRKGFLRGRIGKLTGSIAILSVGAGSDVELREKKDRCDDAIRATKSAIEEGIVPGGGSAYLACEEILTPDPSVIKRNFFGFIAGKNGFSDYDQGMLLIKDILSAPFKQICQNAGVVWSIERDIIRRFPGQNAGYDVKAEKTVDMISAGIIDPTKAARCALEFAAGIAGLLLITETLVINVEA